MNRSTKREREEDRYIEYGEKNEERGEMMKRSVGKRKMKETYRGCGSVR